MDSAAYYAEKVVNSFNVYDDKVSAYYILHKYAILHDNIHAADSLAGLRMDEKRKLEAETIDSLNAIRVFQDYLYYCKTCIWRVVGYSTLVIVLVLVVLSILWYWRKKKKHVDAQIEALQSAEEEYQQTIEEQRQQRHDALMSHIELVRTRHPKPDKKWNDYSS